MSDVKEDRQDADSEKEYSDEQFELIMKQYERAGQMRRRYQSELWNVMSVIVGVNAGIIIITFKFTTTTIAQLALVLIGIALTSVALIAAIKHRYLAISASDTLRAIEEEFNVNVIQLRTEPANKDYWNETSPDYIFQNLSSARGLMWGIFIVLLTMVGVFIHILPMSINI